MGLCESCIAGTHASSNRMHSQKEVLLRDSDSADSFGSYVPPSLRNASAITGADVLSSKEALERQHGELQAVHLASGRADSRFVVARGSAEVRSCSKL